MKINLRIKILRFKIKQKDYYFNRKKQLFDYKESLDKRFRIFNLGGIVGDRIWEMEGPAYHDYIYRVKPILMKRIAWYDKKITNQKKQVI